MEITFFTLSSVLQIHYVLFWPQYVYSMLDRSVWVFRYIRDHTLRWCSGRWQETQVWRDFNRGKQLLGGGRRTLEEEESQRRGGFECDLLSNQSHQDSCGLSHFSSGEHLTRNCTTCCRGMSLKWAKRERSEMRPHTFDPLDPISILYSLKIFGLAWYTSNILQIAAILLLMYFMNKSASAVPNERPSADSTN